MLIQARPYRRVRGCSAWKTSTSSRLQTHLNKLAKTQSKDRVLQIRSYMRAIFAEAVDQDFLSKDPARKVKVPANLRETDKTTLTWDQLRRALAKLDRSGSDSAEARHDERSSAQ